MVLSGEALEREFEQVDDNGLKPRRDQHERQNSQCSVKYESD